jgi:hypothetical protein
MKDKVIELLKLCRKSTPGPWQTRFIFRSLQCARRFAAEDGLLLDARNNDWNDAAVTAELRTAFPAIAAHYLAMLEVVEDMSCGCCGQERNDAERCCKCRIEALAKADKF